jgi:phage repressor protein C with HTH and peptisase S24 domain
MGYDRGVPSETPRRPDRPVPPGTPGTRWWVAVNRGNSMQPTLRDGDRLLVRSGTDGAVVGRLAVIRLPGRPISLKRLAFREASGWWVERDNPREGIDSWNAGIGTIPDADLLGIVIARLWPRPRPL